MQRKLKVVATYQMHPDKAEMAEEIVRLRDACDEFSKNETQYIRTYNAMVRERDDLAVEAARLREENEYLRVKMTQYDDLVTENGGLREALEEIDKKALQAGGGGPYGGVAHTIHNIARNALKGTT